MLARLARILARVGLVEILAARVGLVRRVLCDGSSFGEAGCGVAGCGSSAAEARSALPVVPPPALSMVGQVVPSWN
jgi:hypothetical protein